MKIVANRCTIVRDVRVVKGGSAELYCHINHTYNDPNKTDAYIKTWTRRVSAGSYTNVYVRAVKNKGQNTLMDGAGSTAYMSRVQRSGDDVVRLSSVTEADGGTYGCRWTVRPGAGCTPQSAEFTVTVIGKLQQLMMHIQYFYI